MTRMPIKLAMSVGLFLSASFLFGKQNNVDVHPECFIGSKVGLFKLKDDNTSDPSAYISGLSTSQKYPLKFSYFTLGLTTRAEKCDNPLVWIMNDSTTYIIGYRSQNDVPEIGLYKVDFYPGRKASVVFYKIDQLKAKQLYRGSAFLSVGPTPKLAIRFDDRPQEDANYYSPDYYSEPNGLYIYTWPKIAESSWYLKQPKKIQIRRQDLASHDANVMLYASQILGESLKTPLLRDLHSSQLEWLCYSKGNYCLGFFYGFSCPTRFGDTGGNDHDKYQLPFDAARDCSKSQLYENLLQNLKESDPNDFFKYPFQNKKVFDAYISGNYAEYFLSEVWLDYLSTAAERVVTDFRPKQGQRITREDYLAQTIPLFREKERQFIAWSEVLSKTLNCQMCPRKINIQDTLKQMKQSTTTSRIEFENLVKTAVARVPAKKLVFPERFTYEIFYSDKKFSKKQIDSLNAGKISLERLLESWWNSWGIYSD